MRLNPKSLKFKIILFTTVCVMLVGVLSNLFLYQFMNGIILGKAEKIDTMYLNNIQTQLNTKLQEIHTLANICSNDSDVAYYLGKPDVGGAQAALRVQKYLNNYIHSSSIERYVRRMIVFNENGASVHATAQVTGNSDDIIHILETSLYQQRLEHDPRFGTLTPSIVTEDGNCLAALYPVDSPGVLASSSYLYVEISLDIITDMLAPYSELNDIFVTTGNGDFILSSNRGEAAFIDMIQGVSLKSGDVVTSGGTRYCIYIQNLETAGLVVYNCVNISTLDLDSQKISYTVFMTILTSLIISIGTLIIVSNYITRPIRKLISRIKKISNENDFTFDPEIEHSHDEIGEIGHVVNEMSVSIQNLLNETISNSEERKNIEIALLQSQVNPHFLYNTLDSIHWMAVIQKNPGICNITRSLVNLLKNMAKGFSAKIPLEEELSLLNDYTTIQSIRYLETFEICNLIDQRYYSYMIIKMTLQPIVENAIFHGIEPKGACGTITLDAYDDEAFLYITVHDSGVGMTQEEIKALMTRTHKQSKDSMNGIGVTNVDKRLKLTYGSECGLTFESKKGEYTQVTIKIRKEMKNDV